MTNLGLTENRTDRKVKFKTLAKGDFFKYDGAQKLYMKMWAVPPGYYNAVAFAPHDSGTAYHFPDEYDVTPVDGVEICYTV